MPSVITLRRVLPEFYDYRTGTVYDYYAMCVVLLQTFVEAEKVENKAKQEQLKGNSIRYDECVQLRHTLTGKCICVAREISETEDSKLKVPIV